MDINQLSEIVKKKILDNKLIDYVELEDKSFLHKNHKTNNRNKFHIKLKIKSEKLKNMDRIQSNKIISFMKSDKKNNSKNVNIILIQNFGRIKINYQIKQDALRKFLISELKKKYL